LPIHRIGDPARRVSFGATRSGASGIEREVSTMDRIQAKAFVEELAKTVPGFAPMKDRALQLIDKPNDIRQGAFFICGLSAMVRNLLEQADLQLFADLLSTIFRQTKFRRIEVDTHVLDGRTRQWSQKLNHESTLPPGARYIPRANHQLDFILARALGKLLKIVSKDLYEGQLRASEQMVRRFRAKPGVAVPVFSTPADFIKSLDGGAIDANLTFLLDTYSWVAQYSLGFGMDPKTATIRVNEAGKNWTVTVLDDDFDNAKREFQVRLADDKLIWEFDGYTESAAYQKDGDLGLDQNGVRSIMRLVLGIDDYKYATLAEAGDFAAVNAAFDTGKPLVLAFVNGIDSWLDASSGKARQFDVAAKPPHQYLAMPQPVGEHLVAITGKITRIGGRVQVPTWSWGTTFIADIPEANLAGYIASFAWGHL
jgi:hypothetical protein